MSAKRSSLSMPGDQPTYLATPAVESRHGVLVLPAWWGLCGGQGRDIGVVGFSLGAYWALWLAEQKSSPVTATVAFYGTRPGDYAASRSAFQFHFAEIDPYESAAGVKRFQKKLLASGRAAEFHTYPGTTHWFFEKDRPEAYNAFAAKIAWQRTVKFLKQHAPS